MILKKKEIIAASLVVLIGVAGYLNWSYQDTIKVQDGDSYIETGKKLGEAQYVNADANGSEDTSEETAADTTNNGEQPTEETAADTNNDEQPAEETNTEQTTEGTAKVTEQTGGENYFEQARLDKETSRSKSLEILNQTAENESFDEEIRKKAGEKVLAVADNVRKETEIESIAQSKGYSEICVYADEGVVSVMVRKDGFSDEDVVKLTDIVTEQMEISAQNVKIVEVK